MVRLFTDTSSNLPFALLQKYNIKSLPFSYMINGVPEEYPSEADFDGKHFYGLMRSGVPVSTSLVNVGLFLDGFEPFLKAGDDILYVGMSGGISGTANAANIAVTELKDSYPDRQIIAIDTFAASLGEGLMVLDAAMMLEQGTPLDDVVEYLLNARKSMCQYFVVDDLMYLKRGGRISSATAIIGNMLNIKPVLTGDEIGRIKACDKVRGEKNGMKWLAERCASIIRDPGDTFGIAHADNEASADLLIAFLRERGVTGECIKVDYEPVTGSHVGPGTVALFYPGKHK